MLPRLVVNCKLDFVRLVHVNIVILGFPSIIFSCPSSRAHLIFDLDGNKCIRGAAEASGRRVINIFDRDDSNRELTGQWFSQVWHIDTVVCKT